jgi:2-octaprenyl-6-methoxyphenol hydroxylase
MNVCIIGSGLTSLSLAKGLINLGLKVDLFSHNTQNIYDKSQTLGISQSNIDFFNKNILNINHLLWDINRIEIFSENLKNEKILNFENKKKQLFSIIKNYKFYNYLLSNLKKNKLFTIKKNKKIILSNQEYNLIINSDSNHPITKKFFFKKLSKNYNSYGHVTTIEHKRLSSNNVAIQIFTKKGPVAFLPVSKEETSVVYSARGKKKIEKRELQYLIKKNLKKYDVKKINDIKTFELKSADLRTYYHDNILAFGDLLHKIHPLAGQGFNMSIRDMKVLIKLVNFKINLGIQLDSSICSEFEKNAKPHNYLFSNSIDFIYELFNIESKTSNILMSKSIQLLGKNKSLNKFFTKLADTGIII